MLMMCLWWQPCFKFQNVSLHDTRWVCNDCSVSPVVPSFLSSGSAPLPKVDFKRPELWNSPLLPMLREPRILSDRKKAASNFSPRNRKSTRDFHEKHRMMNRYVKLFHPKIYRNPYFNFHPDFGLWWGEILCHRWSQVLPWMVSIRSSSGSPASPEKWDEECLVATCMGILYIYDI